MRKLNELGSNLRVVLAHREGELRKSEGCQREGEGDDKMRKVKSEAQESKSKLA